MATAKFPSPIIPTPPGPSAPKLSGSERPAGGQRPAPGEEADSVAARPPPVGPPKLTAEEHQKLGAACSQWEARIRDEAQRLKVASTAVLEVEAELSRQVGQGEVLRKQQLDLQTKNDLAKRSMDLIWAQQETVSDLLTKLEETLGLASSTPGSLGRRSQERAAQIEGQLEELSRQIRLLALDTASFEAQQAERPIQAVARVLNAHTSELDAVQARLDAAERRLRSAEARVS